MATTHYNFTELDNSSEIDIVGDTSTFLNEIDTALYEGLQEAGVKDGSITTAKLADNAVTNAKLADNAVTNAKLADNAVTNSTIANAAVTTLKIADEAVTSTELADNAVTFAKIAYGAVKTSSIYEGSVTAEKLSSTGIDTLLSGLTIRHFNNKSNSYDNGGMPLEANYGGYINIEGYYVEEWGLVIISRLYKHSNDNDGSTPNYPESGVPLPNYIPKPTETIWSGITIYDDMTNWHFIGITSSGTLKLSTAGDANESLAGSGIFFINSNANSANSLSDYTNNNGVV